MSDGITVFAIKVLINSRQRRYFVYQIELIMDRLTGMQVFTEVADRASLTEAAGALDMSRAMVSRYLENFERWLGVRLLHRTTLLVSLTEAGEEALQRCRPILELSRDVQPVVSARRAAPEGKLRITASTSFAAASLTPAA